MELTDKSIAEMSKIDLVSEDVFFALDEIDEDYERERLLALLKLRAEELKFLPDFNRVYKKYKKFKEKIDCEYEKEQLNSIRKNKGELYQREYIVESRFGGLTVSVPLLADYIKKNMKYIFARSDVKSGIQRYVYENGVYRHVSDNEFKGYIKNLIPIDLQMPRIINDTFNLLVCDTQCHTEISKLNTDENIINFQNGLLYLDTMELKPHTPDVLSTIQIPCNFVHDVPAPENSAFDRFINHLCYNDPERVQFLLEFMGVALSNIAGYRMKKALFMVGKGDTGKSQIKELLNRLIGDEYFSSIELSDLEQRFGAANLYGKRIAGSNDMKYMNINQLSIFKNLTGGDNVFSEFKGENGFNFKYRGVLWFCMNELPKFGGDHGDWVYERIIILDCNNPVPHKDPYLLDKMYAEREYIVSRCVKAVKKVIDNGYKYDIPQCCYKLRESYKIENDSVLRFIRECTEPRTDEKYSGTPTTGQVYNAYKAWCKDNETNGFCETAPAFRKALQQYGYGEQKKIGGNNYYTKFVLTLEAKKQYNIYDRL